MSSNTIVQQWHRNLVIARRNHVSFVALSSFITIMQWFSGVQIESRAAPLLSFRKEIGLDIQGDENLPNDLEKVDYETVYIIQFSQQHRFDFNSMIGAEVLLETVPLPGSAASSEKSISMDSPLFADVSVYAAS